MARKVKSGNGNDDGDKPTTAQGLVNRVTKALQNAARRRKKAKRPTPMERAARKEKANDED